MLKGAHFKFPGRANEHGQSRAEDRYGLSSWRLLTGDRREVEPCSAHPQITREEWAEGERWVVVGVG
jgi:hypothetical protein